VASLHKKLLTDSPIPKFGLFFMTKFYYKKLISAKLIRCLLYIKDSKVVGFIVITEFPGKFMIDGFIKYFSYLCYVMLLVILKNPFRLFIIFKLLILSIKRKTAIADNTSELLSIAVDPNYRKIIDKPSGLKISHYLFQNAAKFLKVNGFNKFQIITDKNNDRAISFYNNYDVKLQNLNFYNSNDQILLSLDLNFFSIKNKLKF